MLLLLTKIIFRFRKNFYYDSNESLCFFPNMDFNTDHK